MAWSHEFVYGLMKFDRVHVFFFFFLAIKFCRYQKKKERKDRLYLINFLVALFIKKILN